MNGKQFLAMGKVTLEDYNDLLIELEEYIKEFLEDKEIEKNKFTSMQWAACLMYLYRHTFRVNPRYLFKTDSSNKLVYDYDIFKVDKVLDIYLYLCYIYGFRICIDHFCFFTGINKTTIFRWKQDYSTLYIDSDSDLYISSVNKSNIDLYDSPINYIDINNTGVNGTSNIDIDNRYISDVYQSSNSNNVNSSSDVYSNNIDIESLDKSSIIPSGVVGNVKLTIKRNDIYNRLVNNTLIAADDLMLSKHGVNSIAYRNMINERYANKAQENIPVLETADLAKQLGISKELASLPDKESE